MGLPRGIPFHLGNLLSQVGEDLLCFLCIYEGGNQDDSNAIMLGIRYTDVLALWDL